MGISLFIPCHKFNKNLEKTFISVKQQSISFDNVWIIDNNSGSKLMKELAIKYGFHYDLCLSQGASFARNRSLILSQDEYFCFLDSDVVLDKDWLKHMLNHFKEQGCIAAQSCIIPSGKNTYLNRYRFKKKRVISNKTFNDFFNIYDLPILNTAALMVEARFFKIVGGFEVQLKRFEDVDFTYKLKELGKVDGCLEAKSFVFFHDGVLNYLKRSYLNGKYSHLFEKLWNIKKKNQLQLTCMLGGEKNYFYFWELFSFHTGRFLNRNRYKSVKPSSLLKRKLISVVSKNINFVQERERPD